MKKLIIFFTVFLVLLGCENQEKNDDFSLGSGYYDIVPGTPEWKELKNHDEMLQATSLSEELLQTISTTDLAEACLAYPLLGDMRFFNDFKTGTDNVISRFNGLQELLNRKDAGRSLLSIYKTMDPEKISSQWSDIKIGKFLAEMNYIELIMSQDKILNSLSKAEKRDLIKTAYNFANKKAVKSEIFGLFSQKPGVYLISRTLFIADFTPFVKKVNKNKVFKSFVQIGPMVKRDDTISIINSTLKSANDFLNK